VGASFFAAADSVLLGRARILWTVAGLWQPTKKEGNKKGISSSSIQPNPIVVALVRVDLSTDETQGVHLSTDETQGVHLSTDETQGGNSLSFLPGSTDKCSAPGALGGASQH
jgi:hypothetical protein